MTVGVQMAQIDTVRIRSVNLICRKEYSFLGIARGVDGISPQLESFARSGLATAQSRIFCSVLPPRGGHNSTDNGSKDTVLCKVHT